MSSLIRWRSRRGLALRGLAVAVAVATVGVAPPAHAAPSSPTSAVPTTTTTPTTPAGGDVTATVTLITGHKVQYAEGADGRATATVVSGPDGAAKQEQVRSYSDPTGLYVIPQSAEGLLATGTVDQELFNVQYLARNGYADDRAAVTPLIVSYATATAARSATSTALPGATRQRDLHSLSGAGVTVAKAQAGAFWSTLTRGGAATRGPATTAAPTLGAGVRKVWLDRLVEVDLSESVPLIGAPEAWAAGYDGTGVKVAVLDTGIDATHPDLQGKVVDSKSFITGETVVDGQGHGTHVAATIVGSGAGSDGRRKGVAPGADLIVGKVLSNAGKGPMSGVIDGMEWAATSGAKVVSMSLGSGPSDGTDPSSQAVNRLTAETGTLFVIAAGNEGGASTVSAPGAADAALTVAAMDKNDKLASFSSRGPRLGDRALKPDISAPGVAIVAARAKGTGIGTPVDDLYTSANGTSMATPHVAGAAAVLAQRHPAWNATQLKPTLMSTTKDNGYTGYEQGAGRLDVARAVRQQVATTTVNVDFGTVSPNTQPTVDKQVTFTNPTGEPVTLTLTPKLRSISGQDGSSALTAPGTVTVPAGGTADVTVSLATADLERGMYTGSVVAVDDATGTRLTVSVGVVRQPPMRKITTRIVGPVGEPLAGGTSACMFLNLNDENGKESYSVLMGNVGGGSNVTEGTGYVPDGVYHMSCTGATWSSRGSFTNIAWIEEPQYTVDGDTTIEYDLATDSVPIPEIATPLPSELVHQARGSSYTTASGAAYASFGFSMSTPYGTRFHVVPSKTKATIGDFMFWNDQMRGAPEAVTTVRGNGSATVRPVYVSDTDRVPKFETDQRLELATKEDLLAGRDVRGKLVVVDSEPWASIHQEMQLATDAGAAGVLNHVVGETASGHGTTPGLYDATLPVLWLDGNQWQQVAKVLAGATRPYVDIKAQTTSPYEYKLRYFVDDKVPATFTERVRHQDLARRQTEQHAQVPATKYQPHMWEVHHTYGPNDNGSINAAHHYELPTNRTDYYGVTGANILWHRTFQNINTADGKARTTNIVDGFPEPGSKVEKINQGLDLFQQEVVGFTPHPDRVSTLCLICRQGDMLYVTPFSTGSAGDPSQRINTGGSLQVSLDRDGVPVTPQPPTPSYLQYNLPADPATYHLRIAYNNLFTGQLLAKKVSTDYTFRSSAPKADSVTNPYICTPEYLGTGKGLCSWQPLIQLSYGLDLALDDTTKAGRAYRFSVTPRHLVPNAPRIVGVKTWVSYDDGAKWTPALVVPWLNGTYQVIVQHPKLEHTSGAVSIRTEAWDSAGNRVTQQIDRAYGLSEGNPLAMP